MENCPIAARLHKLPALRASHASWSGSSRAGHPWFRIQDLFWGGRPSGVSGGLGLDVLELQTLEAFKIRGWESPSVRRCVATSGFVAGVWKKKKGSPKFGHLVYRRQVKLEKRPQKPSEPDVSKVDTGERKGPVRRPANDLKCRRPRQRLPGSLSSQVRVGMFCAMVSLQLKRRCMTLSVSHVLHVP